jgi:hypothetical protein
VNENTGDGAMWLFESTTPGITTRGSKSFTGTALGGPAGDALFGDVLAG